MARNDILKMMLQLAQLRRGMGGQGSQMRPPSTTVWDQPYTGETDPGSPFSLGGASPGGPDLSGLSLGGESMESPEPEYTLGEDGPVRASSRLRERQPGDETGRFSEMLNRLGLPMEQVNQLFTRFRSSI